MTGVSMAITHHDMEILHNEHEAIRDDVALLRMRGHELALAFADLMGRRETMAITDFRSACSRLVAESLANVAALVALTRFTRRHVDDTIPMQTHRHPPLQRVAISRLHALF
jgi:hypothetical protein